MPDILTNKSSLPQTQQKSMMTARS